tara:strand:+ start:720 stop:1178 length:459 start_codon:yes stop_codon:yes gene_type:complete
MARIGSKIKPHFQSGSVKDGEGLGSVGAYRKTIVIELTGAEMAAMADDDILYQFPCAALVESCVVKNTGSTAFVIATTAFLDDSSGDDHHLTADIKVLGAGLSSGLVASNSGAANFVSGEQVLWNLGGGNTTANTASCRVIINAVFSEDIDW